MLDPHVNAYGRLSLHKSAERAAASGKGDATIVPFPGPTSKVGAGAGPGDRGTGSPFGAPLDVKFCFTFPLLSEGEPVLDPGVPALMAVQRSAQEVSVVDVRTGHEWTLRCRDKEGNALVRGGVLWLSPVESTVPGTGVAGRGGGGANGGNNGGDDANARGAGLQLLLVTRFGVEFFRLEKPSSMRGALASSGARSGGGSDGGRSGGGGSGIRSRDAKRGGLGGTGQGAVARNVDGNAATGVGWKRFCFVDRSKERKLTQGRRPSSGAASTLSVSPSMRYGLRLNAESAC